MRSEAIASTKLRFSAQLRNQAAGRGLSQNNAAQVHRHTNLPNQIHTEYRSLFWTDSFN